MRMTLDQATAILRSRSSDFAHVSPRESLIADLISRHRLARFERGMLLLASKSLELFDLRRAVGSKALRRPSSRMRAPLLNQRIVAAEVTHVHLRIDSWLF